MPVEPPTRPGASPDAVPAELLAAWREAEERLYPIVLVRPESYVRAVSLVSRTVARLQVSCPDLVSLVAAAPGVADLVGRLAGEPTGLDAANPSTGGRERRPGGPGTDERSTGGTWGPPGGELDLTLIAAAACAMRHRQLAAELRHRHRATLIAEAAAAGDTWVVIAWGRPSTSWPPLPSTTVELHLPSGRALAETVEVDPMTGGRSFRLARFDLDRVTGDPIGDGPSAPALEYDSEEPWRAAIGEERGRIEAEPDDG